VRRLLMIIAAGTVTLAVGVTLVGCPAAHEGYPGKSCTVNGDCYSDEVCNMTTMMCEPPPADMSVLFDIKTPDFSMPDDLIGADLSQTPDLSPVDL
jgi:hypothetical protein